MVSIELQTEASNSSLGAILMHAIECTEYVISYASISLRVAEQQYNITKEECLSVIWVI